ncbi:MAG: chain length-determining protein, partial [Nitrospirota bacterium]
MKDTKDTSQMDIKKYLQVVNRRKYLFIIASILVLSVIFWGSFFMTKVYEAKSTVFIERNIIKNLVEGIVVTPSLEQSLRVLRYEMLSRSMLLKIVSSLDLDAKVKNKDEIESIVRNFQKDTAITISGNDLFMVSYRGEDPKLVRDYVNTLINRYIEENSSSKREGAFSANQFLTEQINFYKKKMDESEQKIIDFRHEKGVYLGFDENNLTTSLRAGTNEMEETKAK